MTAIFTFGIGIVFGTAIGWAMAALHYNKPRSPDTDALTATPDKLDRDA